MKKRNATITGANYANVIGAEVLGFTVGSQARRL